MITKKKSIDIGNKVNYLLMQNTVESHKKSVSSRIFFLSQKACNKDELVNFSAELCKNLKLANHNLYHSNFGVQDAKYFIANISTAVPQNLSNEVNMIVSQLKIVKDMLLNNGMEIDYEKIASDYEREIDDSNNNLKIICFLFFISFGKVLAVFYQTYSNERKKNH